MRSDDTYTTVTTRQVDLLDTYGLDIRVSESTHEHGGILDVVSLRDLTAPVVDVADVRLSDHILLQWSVTTAKSTPVVETVVRRPWRSLDVAEFRSALSSSVLCQPDHWGGLDVNAMATFYDVEMTALLDRVIPARTITRRPRPSDPWFDAACRPARPREIDQVRKDNGIPPADLWRRATGHRRAALRPPLTTR